MADSSLSSPDLDPLDGIEEHWRRTDPLWHRWLSLEIRRERRAALDLLTDLAPRIAIVRTRPRERRATRRRLSRAGPDDPDPEPALAPRAGGA